MRVVISSHFLFLSEHFKQIYFEIQPSDRAIGEKILNILLTFKKASSFFPISVSAPRPSRPLPAAMPEFLTQMKTYIALAFAIRNFNHPSLDFILRRQFSVTILKSLFYENRRCCWCCWSQILALMNIFYRYVPYNALEHLNSTV